MGFRALFAIVCNECGEEILVIRAMAVRTPQILGNGDIFATCAGCGHTAQYIEMEEGAPTWKSAI